MMLIDSNDKGFPIGYIPKVGDIIEVLAKYCNVEPPTPIKLIIKYVGSYTNHKGGYQSYCIQLCTAEVLWYKRHIRYISSIFDTPEVCNY